MPDYASFPSINIEKGDFNVCKIYLNGGEIENHTIIDEKYLDGPYIISAVDLVGLST